MGEQQASALAADGWERLQRWVFEHDDRWSFTLPYIAAAVVLSVAISLFWLVVVVGVHAVLEWARQRRIDPRIGGVLMRMAWDLKLDVALVLLALAIAVYIDVVLGAVGLGSAARLGVQAGARTAGWGRAIQGILISLDDAAHLVRMAGKGDKEAEQSGRADGGGDGEATEGAAAVSLRPWRVWGAADWVGIVIGIGCVLLIPAAPLLIGVPWEGVVSIMVTEMQPWPGE